MPRRASEGQNIGTVDIRETSYQTNFKFARKFGDSWRARGWGSMWYDNMNVNSPLGSVLLVHHQLAAFSKPQLALMGVSRVTPPSYKSRR